MPGQSPAYRRCRLPGMQEQAQARAFMFHHPYFGGTGDEFNCHNCSGVP